jgi:RecD/TraA family predicted helicase
VAVVAPKSKKNLEQYHEIEVIIERKRMYRGDYGIYVVQVVKDSEELGFDDTTDGNTRFTKKSAYTTTVKGTFDKEFYPGEQYVMYGTWQFNEQYKTKDYSIVSYKNPINDPNQVKAFLLTCTNSNRIVDQIVNKYGKDAIKLFADDQLDYGDIDGMGDALYNTIRDKVLENLYMQEIIMELSQYDVTVNQMRKIMRKFGASAAAKVKENPYLLCKIRGIGFVKADKIAQNMGISAESPFRIIECVKYALEQCTASGHTWSLRNSLADDCYNAMKMTCRRSLIEDAIDNTYQTSEGYTAIEGTDGDVLLINGTRLTLRRYYEAELFIATFIKKKLTDSKPLKVNVDAFVEKVKADNPTITEQQISLFSTVRDHAAALLVGYAGCGKSWITKMLLDMVRGSSILLLAPTGKAAKVIEEYTGSKASTIHRAIGIYGGDDDEEDDGDGKNESWHDWIIVDESSMGDVVTIAKLLKAVKNPNARLLFIGDDFQLTSVGAGNFLHDLKNGNIPMVELTKVFRQSEGGILDIATKVRNNEKWFADNFPLNLPVYIKDEEGNQIVNPEYEEKCKYGNDMVIHPLSSGEVMQKGILFYYREALKRFAPDEIVVVTPMKKYDLGTEVLNKLIQEIVNPASPGKKQVVFGKDERISQIYREGDRIINIKNNYKAKNIFDQETTIYNGDMGVIKSIDNEKGQMVVDYGFDEVRMSTNASGLGTIIHAYALTIHKSQGSGFKCVIMVTDKSHRGDPRNPMLTANLIYTGITRTREQMYWVCQADIVNHAMNVVATKKRNCFLAEMLAS